MFSVQGERAGQRYVCSAHCLAWFLGYGPEPPKPKAADSHWAPSFDVVRQ